MVTARAAAPCLSHLMALAEVMRRRRIQGDAAEQVFARLIGLTFHPRRTREAAELWAHLSAQASDTKHGAFQNYPDVMSTASGLASSKDFFTVRCMAQNINTKIDANLASLLDEALGYVEGTKEVDGSSPGGFGDRNPASADTASREPDQPADPASAGARGGDSPGEPDGQDPTDTDKD